MRINTYMQSKKGQSELFAKINFVLVVRCIIFVG